MPQLANAQHESFCQHVVSGHSLTESAKRCGHPQGAANFGARLMERAEIAQRIIELQSGPADPGEKPASGQNKLSPSQAVLTYTEKPWIIAELVSTHRFARKLKEPSVCHAVLKTLAQLGGHLDGNSRVSDPARDPQRLALLGISEIHAMLTQVMGKAPRQERAKLLAEAPELAGLVAEIPEPAEPEPPAGECTPDAGV